MLTFQITVFTLTTGSPITPTDIQKRKYIEIGHFRNVSLVIYMVNLDTLSSDSSEEEIKDSGRSFQSLIVWGKKLYLFLIAVRQEIIL